MIGDPIDALSVAELFRDEFFRNPSVTAGADDADSHTRAVASRELLRKMSDTKKALDRFAHAGTSASYIDPELLKPLEVVEDESAPVSRKGSTDPGGWKALSVRWLRSDFPAYVSGTHKGMPAHDVLVTALARMNMFDHPEPACMDHGEHMKMVSKLRLRVAAEWSHDWHQRMAKFVVTGERDEWIHELWDGAVSEKAQSPAPVNVARQREVASDAPTPRAAGGVPLDQDIDAVVANELTGAW